MVFDIFRIYIRSCTTLMKRLLVSMRTVIANMTLNTPLMTLSVGISGVAGALSVVPSSHM